MRTNRDRATRKPVAYRYDALNPDFLRLLADIAGYADQKYGAAEQYTSSRLVKEASPVNHIYEHLRQYQVGEPYDHFDGDPAYHLAAVAYNAMMEFWYLRTHGHLLNPLVVAQKKE
jgi:hypothetical protein